MYVCVYVYVWIGKRYGWMRDGHTHASMYVHVLNTNVKILL